MPEESLPDVCSKLWQLDTNRFERGRDYEIDLDSGKGAKLFSCVNADKLTKSPTYKAFTQLLNNYKSDTSVPEQETALQTDQNRAFLNQCLKTKVMEEALRIVCSRNFVPKAEGNKKAFKEILYNLWFELHPRPSGDGTNRSAFEHVFVGETSGRQIIGFHNWVQLYEEERLGNVVYKGCTPRACGDHVIAINFKWNGMKLNNKYNKNGKTLFVGTSPEFELALYTVCFLAGREETTVTLGNDIVTIVIHIENGQIGACYPKLQGRIQIPESQLRDVPIAMESGESSTPEEDQEIEVQAELARIILEEHRLPVGTESEENATSEQDEEVEDEPETARLIKPGEDDQSPARNDKVRIHHDDRVFLRRSRRHERKATEDPDACCCNCTIL
ncbi:uridylate-specific endoribonuclease B-like [Branchiostoma floridae x Branchiostoma japonicum]